MYKNRVNSHKLLKKNAIIADLLSKHKPEIAAAELVVYAWDECQLQGDNMSNYLWDYRQEPTLVRLDNQRDRQTYYGAENLVSKKIIVKPYKAGTE